MPITSSFSFNVSEPLIGKSFASVIEARVTNSHRFNTTDSMSKTGIWNQPADLLDVSHGFNVSGDLVNVGQLIILEAEHSFNFLFNQIPSFLNNSVLLNLIDIKQKNITLFLSDFIRKLNNSLNFSVNEPRIRQLGILNQFVSTITNTGSITLTDDFGPRILNEIPSSGSTFNSPLSDITFELKDVEGSTIVLSTVDLFINETQVISSGANVTPSGFGVTTFTATAPNRYLFSFSPSVAFDTGDYVTISGKAKDSVSVTGNLSNLFYQFKTWGEGNLSATITALPDTLAPTLQNQDPFPNQIEVTPSSNIYLEIFDQHTGLNNNSTTILVNDHLVVLSGTENDPDFAAVTSSGISLGRGRAYTINPTADFGFDEEVIITVSACDSYPIPNCMIESYSFRTMYNGHLLASGLSVLTTSGWQEMELLGSYDSTASGTDFRVSFVNVSGLGVNTSGSYVKSNGITISSVFTPVSPPDIYDVYFTLAPDYTTDADLLFHIEQDTLVSGTTIFREIERELLWGAEYCYDPDTNLTFSTELPIRVQAQDWGDLTSVTSKFYKITTAPQPKNDLRAEIVAVSDIGRLPAEIVPITPFFEYGKTMNFELTVSDFAGNVLHYTWSFKIEEKP